MNKLSAQNLINGFNAAEGNINFSLSYTYETFDELYFDEEPMDVTNMLGEFQVHSVSFYAEYAITDRLDAIVTFPYIITQATSPTSSQEVNNFQDMSILAKYSLLRKEMNSGMLNVVGAAGIGFPLSDYDPSVPVTIGSHAVNGQFAVAGINRFNSGLFTEVSFVYIVKAENVPNNISAHGKFGYLSDKFYSHLWYQIGESFNGTTLGSGNDLQLLQVDTQRIGGLVSYRILPKFNVFLGAGTLINGRNTANTDFFINTGISTSLYFLN